MINATTNTSRTKLVFGPNSEVRIYGKVTKCGCIYLSVLSNGTYVGDVRPTHEEMSIGLRSGVALMVMRLCGAYTINERR